MKLYPFPDEDSKDKVRICRPTPKTDTKTTDQRPARKATEEKRRELFEKELKIWVYTERCVR